MATGTKTIGGEYLSSEGKAVNDCHAEIICRRLLMRYLYSQLRLHLNPATKGESILSECPSGGYQVKEEVKFHLYISTAPCGDSRIFSPHDRKGKSEPDRKKTENGQNGVEVKEEVSRVFSQKNKLAKYFH